jgi:hypothetical protein
MIMEVCKLLTIHFFKSSSKVSRVGKAYKPITLCFSSSLISNNLDKIKDNLTTANYKENNAPQTYLQVINTMIVSKQSKYEDYKYQKDCH